MGVRGRIHVHVFRSLLFEVSHRICRLNAHHDDNDDNDNNYNDDDHKGDYDDEEKTCTETHWLLLYLSMDYLTPDRFYLKIITKLAIGVNGSEKQGCRCGESTRLPPNKM